ncbi:MFS transporter [Thauera linaloolentis]|uniref:EmrB/QacA subfamily drug resistance transporter n=1 Tax=Thauera linaloolentis (strain DSM 12138 / JCM 21573 / CCUG 41526 / CIP 105981 / IAM 15112 / NBRC 102519 / 47Lol) TaxID=1123367 RepID=N6YUL8_THAL4|nr:MFS transporter [Thauera linaloolentis]ENO83664.1 EmrB/QacA subfamily drug resistance transporter [Thauera linaloolentis 47Lol = DSM 12138]MCM8564246.1 MFS transporter [Thauera linaloolentis]
MTASDLPRRIPLIVAGAFFMQVLDSTIISTSLPQMADAFGVRALDLSFGITIYMLAVAACIPASGWLADRYGSRNVFAAAIVVFSLASLACGLADSLPTFIAARAVQGVGGALMTPVGRLVVLRNTPKAGLLQATALLTWPALIAPVLGPVLGGFITTYASWRWNFLINLPIGLAGLLLALRFIPNLHGEAPRRFDGRGFLLSAGAMVLLLHGLESIGHAGADLGLSAAFCVAGSVLGVAALRHFRRAAEPLLDLSPFTAPTFALTTLSGGFFCRMVISATPFLLPLLFQIGFGLSSWEAGLMIVAYFAGNLGMKTVTTPLLRRFGFRRVLVANGMLGALAIAACGLLRPDTPAWAVAALLAVAGLTRSMQLTALSTLTFADTEPQQRSSASTLSSMLQQVAMIVGVAAGALLVKLSQAAHGLEQPVLADFRNVFAAIGLIGFVAALRFLRLAPDAGAEVSGRPARHAA